MAGCTTKGTPARAFVSFKSAPISNFILAAAFWTTKGYDSICCTFLFLPKNSNAKVYPSPYRSIDKSVKTALPLTIPTFVRPINVPEPALFPNFVATLALTHASGFNSHPYNRTSMGIAKYSFASTVKGGLVSCNCDTFSWILTGARMHLFPLIWQFIVSMTAALNSNV